MSSGFQSTLSAALKVSLLCGVFPLRKLHGMKYEFSKKLYCYDIVLGLMSTVQGIYACYTVLIQLKLSMPVLLDLFVFFFYSITWIIILTQYYLMRNSLPIIISELDEINSRLSKATYNSFFNFSVLVITIFNIISKIIDLSTRSFNLDYAFASILYFFSTNAPVVVAGQYSVLLYIISRQLEAIAQQLSCVNDNPEIRRLTEIHHALCNLAQRVNHVYDIFLLHVITLSFVVTVLKVYFIIICIVEPDFYANMSALVLTVFDVLVNVCVIVLMVSSAMKASNNVSIKKFLTLHE